MLDQHQKTPRLKPGEAETEWFLIDATDLTLGRLASEVAKLLQGKHRPDFTPGVDSGAGVIIINSKDVHVTGNKEAQKMYRSHSGYIGHLKETPLHEVRRKRPQLMCTQAISKMMPKTKLSNKQLTRLRVFADDQHNMQAQKPQQVNLGE